MVRHFVIFCGLIHLIYAECDNYWQSSSPASTKRPFDICYHSEIDLSSQRSSYRYFCNESNHGNNSINGHTVFLQDFSTIDCKGTPNQTQIIETPFSIHCGSTCDVVRIREYPLITPESCEYYPTVYSENIEVLGVCDDNIQTSQLVSCSIESTKKHYTFDTFFGYGGTCDEATIFESRVNYAGCQADRSSFLEILACDVETPITQPEEVGEECSNYWQSNTDGASSTKRPFDTCYRSYRKHDSADYSYKYICNQTILNETYALNGYQVYKETFSGVGCQGRPNISEVEKTVPYSIYCGGNDCDVVRYRVYEINNSDSNGHCDNPYKINRLNDFEEKLHVLQQCDDDEFTSDSYFCNDNYFFKNTYNNNNCNNDGIYTSEYWYEGCNDYDKFIEIINCVQQPTTKIPTGSPTPTPTTVDDQESGKVENKYIIDTIMIVIVTIFFILY